MEQNFRITEIKRVIMVGKDEYPEKMTSYGHTLNSNELIFHYSGQSTVYFDDLVLPTVPNTIRFLPKGDTKRYDVVRHENGDCIDVFFQTDRSPSALSILTARKTKSLARCSKSCLQPGWEKTTDIILNRFRFFIKSLPSFKKATLPRGNTF